MNRPQYWLELWNERGPLLGTDGAQPYDRRLSLTSCIKEGFARAYNLRNVQPGLRAFRILAGERFSSARAVTQMITLNETIFAKESHNALPSTN